MNHDRRPDDPTPSEAHPQEKRPRLDLSATKVAAGAGASALAAAVGSKLGVAGTIAGAAVASVVSASAGAVLGHSLERGKNAALKARPALEAYQADWWARQAGPDAPREALDATVVLDGGTQGAVAPDAETVPLPSVSDAESGAGAERRGWKDRVPGRKPLVALTVASFVLGTGGVTAYTLARDGGVPGQNGSVFSNNDGRSDRNDPPDQRSPGEGGPGGGGSRHSTPPTPSGSGSGPSSPTPQTPTTTPPTSGTSGSDSPTTSPSTSPSTGPTTPPTSGPATPTSGATSAPSTPATQGTTAPSAPGSATAMGTPTGLATG